MGKAPRPKTMVLAAAVAICAAAAALVVGVASFRGEARLVAECNGTELFAWPIQPGDVFELTYTHSLNQSPVTDVIEWTGADMVVVKSIFKTFGAGIPLPEDVGGSDILFVDGHYELVGMDRRMRGFYVMTQEVPDQKIVYKGQEASLLELAGSGASVYITVKRPPLPLVARFRSLGWPKEIN
ncbi:MAG: DUF1850 domain-containing protein [Oscillospiraceae bacterium]|nr:DUF1850 domain-containing protein [Oscillospiraceae bacterium]